MSKEYIEGKGKVIYCLEKGKNVVLSTYKMTKFQNIQLAIETTVGALNLDSFLEEFETLIEKYNNK